MGGERESKRKEREREKERRKRERLKIKRKVGEKTLHASFTVLLPEPLQIICS